MKQVVFSKQYYASRGGRRSTVNIYSLESFVNGVLEPCRDTIHLCYVDGEDYPMRAVTLQMFEEVFSIEHIRTMQANGMLNYYPDSDKGTGAKYPMFQSKVYEKHGIAKD